MKRRLFGFTSGTDGARVTCSHCGWSSRGCGDAQKVFDRSIEHECAGVESHRDMLARHIAAAANPCERCTDTAATGTCCSSHGKKLCHLCYRQTHWVELCVGGCPECASEGLPINLRDLAVTR
ncbi:hypothetical protein [Micromonospora carbonacea]|uniref:Uncharacterized protein n=1 Tax=Micromonospora carbonacea TaxID=47853 RepID=A0A1C5ACX0_9ACTN|nr:hypothetical protein [Micromonospora carbonacea]SCF42926.1 hypothetical protein GA0070563_112157 [Micromonospora carbonacea]